MLYPSPSVLTIKSLFDYWLNSAAFDLGEDVIIPYDREVASDPFRILLAGGVAGAASRTLTAPFDRLKVRAHLYLLTGVFLTFLTSTGIITSPDILFDRRTTGVHRDMARIAKNIHRWWLAGIF